MRSFRRTADSNAGRQIHLFAVRATKTQIAHSHPTVRTCGDPIIPKAVRGGKRLLVYVDHGGDGSAFPALQRQIEPAPAAPRYFTSTVAPASTNFFLMVSAS